MLKSMTLNFLWMVISLLFFPSRLPALDKIRVGLSALAPTNGAVWVSEEKGLFKKYGIEVEVIVIGGGAARGVNALIAGDLQFATAGGGAVVSASLRGADVVMVASVNNKGVQRLMVRPEIKNPEGLKGKRLGITTFGSSSHVVFLMMLRKWNLSPDEVQVIQVGSSPAMLVSLQKGGIEAAVLTDPAFFVAEDMGYKTLADPVDMDIHYLQSVLITTRSYLRTHREQAGRFIRAYVEGIAYFKKNRTESLRVLMKKMRTERGREGYLERSYELYASQYFDRIPYPSQTGIRTVLEFLAKDNPKAKDADPNSFVDSSLVKALDESGFIRKLYE